AHIDDKEIAKAIANNGKSNDRVGARLFGIDSHEGPSQVSKRLLLQRMGSPPLTRCDCPRERPCGWPLPKSVMNARRFTRSPRRRGRAARPTEEIGRVYGIGLSCNSSADALTNPNLA